MFNHCRKSCQILGPKKNQVTCRWAQFNILPNVLGQIESDSFLKRLPHSLSNCSVPRLTSRLPKPRTSSLAPGWRNVQEKNWASWPPQRMLVCRISFAFPRCNSFSSKNHSGQPISTEVDDLNSTSSCWPHGRYLELPRN